MSQSKEQKNLHGKLSLRVKLAGAFVFSVFVFLLALECLARLLLSSPDFLARFEGNDEASLRLSWVRRHQHQPGMDYLFDVYSPNRGWAIKPLLRDRETYGKPLNTNSRGLRGRSEYSYSRVPGKHRILVLGDSFSFGEEVGDRETFSSYLERLLPNTEVINLGVHGYGHDQMLLYLREEGLKYKPDIILLGFLYYDLERNLLSFRDYAKPKFRLTRHGLKLENHPVPKPSDILKKEFFRSKALDLWTIFFNRWAWENGVNGRKMRRLGAAILDEIAEESRRIGAVPVYVYFPNEIDFNNFFDDKTPREKFLLEYCKSRDSVKCTSVRPAFLDQWKKSKSVDYYGHWDHEGHLLAAYTIRDFLVREGLAPESPGRLAAKSTKQENGTH